MLRVLFVILLLLNLLVLAWNLDLLAPAGLPADHGREPERLHQQVRPELLQVMPLGVPARNASQAASQAAIQAAPASDLPAASSASKP